MPIFIQGPSLIEAAGTKPKIIEEYFGQVNSKESGISIARMKSPQGWVEPGQTPDFDEYTVVLKGCLQIEYGDGLKKIQAGEAVLTSAGEWVRYSTPDGDCEYIAVCMPAFSMETVHRDQD